MLQVDAVKAFNDNYLWVLHRQPRRKPATGIVAGDHPALPDPGAEPDGDGHLACVVDPGAAEPILRHLADKGLTLGAILVTHHHADHIGGIDELLQSASVPVYGPATPRIPQVTHPVHEGSTFRLLGHDFRVVDVPGHTREHIAYVVTVPGYPRVQLFCGDTLFAAGCGRMFEGTPPQMHASLQKLAALPEHTLVYCAHEYTLSNLRFAAAAMPDNRKVRERIEQEQWKRDHDMPTVPSSLGNELQTNPFLRCSEAEVIAAASAREPDSALDPASVFGILRRWKDSF